MRTLVERLTALAEEASLQARPARRAAAVSRLNAVLEGAETRELRRRMHRSVESFGEIAQAARRVQFRLAYYAAQLDVAVRAEACRG